MNNILLDTLPETVTVRGKEYFIDTDYRTCIIFEKLVSDSTLSSKEKVEGILGLFYVEERPDDLEGAIGAIKDFYSEYRKSDKKPPKKNGNVVIKEKPILDYDIDAPYIYAAFLTQYRIDLNEIEYLHWWKFQAMFRGLEGHNKIVEIMSYRNADLSKIEDKNERKRIARMQSIYALPDNMSVEDHIASAGIAFGGGVSWSRRK